MTSIRFLPLEHGAGAVIQLSLDPLDLPSRDLVTLRAFRNVLPEEAIGVFIRASLPRSTGMREVDGDPSINRQWLVFAHLFARISVALNV
jgi:hypothetical protein